jgi:glutathione S-transferase
MLRVFGRTDSSNVQKVLWCLGELGQPFEREDYGGPFGRTREPAYLRLNPNATVPTLLDDDIPIWESNTIVRYLAAKYGAHTLYPEQTQRRAMVERWMDWQLWTMAGAFVPLLVALREKRPAEELAPLRARVAPLFAVLDGALAGRYYIEGSELTVADIALGPMIYRWYNAVDPREEMPHLRAWYDRLTQRPAYREHVMAHMR